MGQVVGRSQVSRQSPGGLVRQVGRPNRQRTELVEAALSFSRRAVVDQRRGQGQAGAEKVSGRIRVHPFVEREVLVEGAGVLRIRQPMYARSLDNGSAQTMGAFET